MLRSATVGAPVVSLFSYQSAANQNLFAATATDVYDISSLNPAVVPTADISGQTAGYYSTQQIGTVGGDFLYIVNGLDEAQLFDGLAWTAINGGSTPAITGVATSDLSHVWLYRGRLFFVEKDTLNAWYLPVDSIGGTANSVSLAGIFQRGGSLLFGATWSLDSGDGIDDKCVFVSTEGEVAIYAGGNPGVASDWNLEGRYDIAKPLGLNCTMQAGGDLLIGTDDGIVPLSQVIQKDPAALSLSAVTRSIEDLWLFEAKRNTGQVELHKWADEAIAVVVLPSSDRTLVVNLQTGAWAPVPGWEPNCAQLFLGRMFAGFEDGYIRALDETGLDDTDPFTVSYCHSFMGDPTRFKNGQMVRFAFFAPQDFTFKAGMKFDYETEFGAAPSATIPNAGSDYLVWDVGNWDEKLWWSEAIEKSTGVVVTNWISISGFGTTFAPTLQITSGSSQKLDIELIRADYLLEEGQGVVV
ncbi:hypothetical protein [uncultured Roseobacter sp.]|uniref:hypothetical protein n=1 Tax=uncultured Roseobacter sp. TaxID=114847 RepID=UPI0026349506|nr:hypothetical protein [uncultured Roseobacter sp.]